MALITIPYDSECFGDLITAFGDTTLPNCLQIVENADGTCTFDFEDVLSAAQETEFNSFISGWVCPIPLIGSVDLGNGVTVEDTDDVTTKTVWYAAKVSQEIEAAYGAAGFGPVPLVQIRSTIGVENVAFTFSDVNFDVNDVVIDPIVINHSLPSTAPIVFGRSGYVKVSYSIPTNNGLIVRAMLNGVTEINGSRRTSGVDWGVVSTVDCTFVTSVSTGDYITIQVAAIDWGANLLAGSVCVAQVLDSPKGEAGPPGLGEITVMYNGSPLAGAFSSINITSGLIVDNIGGVATISVPPQTTTFGSNYHYVESLGVTSTTASVWISKLQLTTTSLTDAVYRVGVSYKWNYDSASSNFRGRLLHNGSAIGLYEVEPSEIGGSYLTTASDQKFVVCDFINLSLSGVNDFTIEFSSESSGVKSSIWDAKIELWRVQ